MWDAGRADVILANSNFTARVFKAYFPSIHHTPKIVYPGINLAVYDAEINSEDADVKAISSSVILFFNKERSTDSSPLARAPPYYP